MSTSAVRSKIIWGRSIRAQTEIVPSRKGPTANEAAVVKMFLSPGGGSHRPGVPACVELHKVIV